VKLELRDITKRFGSLVANDHIDLVIQPGEIRALLGENGAGKTTLMNVLYGLMQPDEGEILIDGKQARFHSPKDAIAAGIGMVHQHFMLVPVFTVAENVTLGIEETRKSGLLDRRKTRKDVRELSRRYGLEIDPDALVENLPVGIQQRVEIVKALVREATVLILDEPTAVLTPAETEDLFRIIRRLKDGGTSVVFISHKLKEVQAIADTITVLRRGAVVGQRPPSATEDELAERLGVSEDEMREARQADLVFSSYSLDAPLSDREDPALLADVLGDDDPGVAHTIDMESVNAHWDELPEREQRILVMRYYGNLTQTEIGDRLGISQMHVSRLLARALAHLRSKLVDPPEEPSPSTLTVAAG